MTQEDQDTLVQLEQDEERSRRHRKIGVWVLVAVLIVLSGVLTYVLIAGEHHQDQVDALAEQLSDSDQAAVEVAEQRQAQARTVLELCESGAIEQDAAGQAVCDEAEQAAQEDPEQAVAQAKGEQGPQGPPGRPGRDGADGADGADASPAEPGRDGRDGTDGDDSTVPGPTGAPGADGEDSTVPGPKGDQGESVKGEKCDTGAAGRDGKSVTGPQGPVGPAGKDGAPGKDSTVPGPAGPSGPPGADGSDGRGIKSAQCGTDGRWTITYSDDTSEDAGPCIAATPDDPAPTPTPEEETP